METKRSPSKSAVEGLRREFQEDGSGLRQRENDTEQLELLIAQTRNALEKKTWLNAEYDKVSSISTAAFLFGAIMSSFGFWNWYRFQVYQDRVIKGQSEQFAISRLKDEQEEIPG